jgi:hypothetical protein
MIELPSTFTQFLAFLGTPIFASFVVSEVLEHIKAFQNADSQRKALIVLALSLALGLLSYALVRWIPPTVVEQWQPIYNVIVGTIAAFIGGQIYHNQTHPSDKVPDAEG